MEKDTIRFKTAQASRDWSNSQAAKFFGRCTQTISNWRNGHQTIPAYVWKMLELPVSESATRVKG